MKNGTIFERLNLQGREIQSNERKVEISLDSNKENSYSINLENKAVNNQKNSQTLNSFLSLISSGADYMTNLEEQIPKLKKKKKKKLRP